MKIRVITPVYNECELLPGFLRHYEKIADSIVIWDNGSIDGSAEIAKAHPRVEYRIFTTESYDVPAVMNVLAKSKDDSRGYDWCLFPDCDELLTMRDGSSLRAYLEKVDPKYDVIRATGYTLVKHADESAFDGRMEWFGQRKFGFPEECYNKPIIIDPSATVLLSAGNHRLIADRRTKKGEDAFNAQVHEDPAVVLIHFEMIDFYLWYYRKTRRAVTEKHRSSGLAPRFGLEDKNAYHSMWKQAMAKARFLDKEVPVLTGAAG
jgi:glycosyltransferase involved in cell wall biosynthesis